MLIRSLFDHPMESADPLPSGGGAAPATETLPPMEDTIRDELRRLGSSELAGDDAGDGGEEAEPGRVRDPATGRFVGKAGEEVEQLAEQPEEASEPIEDEPAEQPADEAAVGDVTRPPNTWRGEAKALYDALPPQVKAEIHKREQDFHRGIGEYRGWAQIGQSLHQTVQQHEPMLREAIKAGEYENAQEAVSDSLSALATLRTGSADEKAALVLNLVNRFGITAESLQAAQQRQQSVDPQLAQIQKDMRELRKAVTRQPVEQQSAGPPPEVIATVEQFIADPKNEFAKTLRVEMARLIDSGLATSLQEAYDKACELNPTVKAKLAARQQQAETKRRAEAAARARKASSVNVVRRGQPPTATPKGTMEDTIRAGLRELRSR